MRNITVGGDSVELRRILYGYKKEQFNYLIEPNEAEIVREIFSAYVNGKALVEIANSLTENGVVYFKDKTDWSKNAVKRILENAHYMGDNEYQKIIEKETFESAEMAKLSKGGGKRETDSKEIKYLKQYCVCEKCGKRFTRMSKYKTRERWYCSGGCSYTKKYLDDITLNTMIEEIISSVKVNPDLLNTNDTQNIVLSQELLKKERNIKYLMSQSEPSFLPVQKLLYECVSDKFNELIMGTSAEVTDELKKYIVMYESKKKTLDVDFMKNTVSKIIIGSDGNIRLRFINEKEISNKSEDIFYDAE